LNLYRGKVKTKNPLKRPLNQSEKDAILEAADAAAKGFDINFGSKDPLYPADKWMKNTYIKTNSDGTKVEVHYYQNRSSGKKENFTISLDKRTAEQNRQDRQNKNKNGGNGC
jgi:hypothetical protein